MDYSKEEIKCYEETLRNYSDSQEVKKSCHGCHLCECTESYVEHGCYVYEGCGAVLCRAFGFDPKDYERLLYRKKSIYQRKYHYDKKIDQVTKRLSLNEDEKYCLFKKLMEIDKDAMEKLNEQFCRKRKMSIFYLIKKFLEEMGNEKYKLVYLKISKKNSGEL